jgi:L-2-hydroxyglutarate oxidase
LVDDFVIERDGRVVHVLNAPSPAATAALEIAAYVAAAARVPN